MQEKNIVEQQRIKKFAGKEFDIQQILFVLMLTHLDVLFVSTILLQPEDTFVGLQSCFLYLWNEGIRRGLTCGAKRIQAGRPSKKEMCNNPRRQISLKENIDLNKPNAKSHGNAH